MLRKISFYSGTNSLKDFFESILMFFFFINKKDEIVINKYENKFSEFSGCKYNYSFGSGRMSLYVILDALNIKKNDEIILPAFTCVVVVNALIYRGIKPIFVDINMNDFNIDSSQIEKKITKKTRAIYAQNTFGLLCDIKFLNKISSKYNIPVIEDAAHSLGSSLNNKLSGSLTTVSFFSTDHSKIINTHLGGMVSTNNIRLAKKIKKIYDRTPFLSLFKSKLILLSFILEYVFYNPNVYIFGKYFLKIFRRLGLIFYFDDELKLSKPLNYPYPCRLSSFQCKIGLNQLIQLNKNLNHRHFISKELNKIFNKYDFKKKKYKQSSWLRYSFLSNNKESIIKKNKNIEFEIWFTTVLNGRDKDFHKVGYEKNSCPNAELIASKIINFPTHLHFSKSDLNYIKKINNV